MNSDEAQMPAIDGQFLLNGESLQDENLSQAATQELPHSIKILLESDSTPAADLITLLRTEQSTANGFWRIALAAAAHARQSSIELTGLSEELLRRLDAIVSQAQSSQPELYTRSDFLKRSAKVIYDLAVKVKEKTKEDEQTVDHEQNVPRVDIRRVAHARMSPSLRLGGEGSYVCANFALIEESDGILLAEEFIVEDLLFIATSAISGARGAILAAERVVQPGTLFKDADLDVLTQTAEEIRSDLDALVEIWSRLATSK